MSDCQLIKNSSAKTQNKLLVTIISHPFQFLQNLYVIGNGQHSQIPEEKKEISPSEARIPSILNGHHELYSKKALYDK